jgi:hypothetical protein
MGMKSNRVWVIGQLNEWWASNSYRNCNQDQDDDVAMMVSHFDVDHVEMGTSHVPIQITQDIY